VARPDAKAGSRTSTSTDALQRVDYPGDPKLPGMAKVTVEAPRSVIWLTLGLILADGVVAAVGPAWAIVPVSAGFLVAIMASLLRWRRRIAPEIRAAHPAGTPAPWVEVVWPWWTRRLAAGWIALTAAGFVLLLVLGVIAVVVERLR
jgi:hypothetical protein